MRPLNLGGQVGAFLFSLPSFFVFFFSSRLSAAPAMSCFSQRYGLSLVKH